MPDLSPFRRRFAIAIATGLFVSLACGGLAAAQSFPLTHELQTGQVDEYGIVHVEADDEGALVFEVEMEPERVGPRSSIRRVFFNLLPETSDLQVEPVDEGDSVRFVAHPSRRKLARSGARFDWRIDVHPPTGPERGRRGEGSALPVARFRVFADVPLVVDDLFPVSLTRGGDAVQMVVKMQQGRTPEGERVRWVGGVFEPDEEPPPVLSSQPEEPVILR